MSHTPGPWLQDGSHIYGPRPNLRIICQMHYEGRGYEAEDAANENLILAASELLKVARMAAMERWPRGHRARLGRLAEAAIAKAEGRE